jgi:GxxExxY protein
MTLVIDGRKIAQEIIDELKKLPKPQKTLAAIFVGTNAASESFLKQKAKIAGELDVKFQLYRFDESISEENLIKEVKKIGGDESVGGLIIQLPLPVKFDRKAVLAVLNPDKDIDALTSQAKVLALPVGVVQEVLCYFIATQNTRIHSNDSKEIVEKELSYKLGGVFLAVQNKIGRFCRERQYADALEKELRERGLNFRREAAIDLADRKSNFADFIVENRILLEIKAKPFIEKEDYYQTLRYLESANLVLGLIVNFRQKYLKPKRILNPKAVSVTKLETFAWSSSCSGRVPIYLKDKIVAVVGRGILVGKPIAEWLAGKCQEVIVFHSKNDLNGLKKADLIISGVGKAGLIKPEILKPGAGVIDFGFDMKDGKISGDLDVQSLITNNQSLSFYTPTPGGTGPILVAELFRNFFKLNLRNTN